MNAWYFAFACVVPLGSLPVPDRPPPPPPDHSKLISFIALGGQNGTQQANMHSSLTRFNMTWPQFVQKTLVPQMKWGVRRFLLHLPFGRDDDGSYMSFDSYLLAQQRGLNLIWRDFAKSLRPVVEGNYTAGEPVEVICYLGSLWHQPTFAELRTEPYGDNLWIGRFSRSIQPVLDAGCSLAFDAAATWPADGPEHHAAKMVRALGTRVYIEGTAYPKKNIGHLASFNWVANHEHYWRNIADSDHGNTREGRTKGWESPYAQADQMSGEGILMISGHAAPPNPNGTKMSPTQAHRTFLDWAPDMARRDWSEGFSVAMELQAVVPAMTIEQLIGDD